MRLIILAAAVALAGCTATGTLTPDAQSRVDAAANSRAGQLFCAFQLAGGGQLTAGIIDAAASAVPGAGTVAVIATNMGKQFVDDTCAKAAKNVAGAVKGIAVSPPAAATQAPQVAVAVVTAAR